MSVDVPNDVPCAGCGTLTPYEVGERPGDGSFGEHLATPIGYVFRRTHWDHSCVWLSRESCQGKPTKPPKTDVERKAKQLGTASPKRPVGPIRFGVTRTKDGGSP